MASATAEKAVRNYLTALKSPSALRDEAQISKLEERLKATDDHVKRILLQQQLLEAKSPSLEGYEEDFVTHAKAWASDKGVGSDAFLAEGVSRDVLRRAGFQVAARGRGGRRRRAAGTRTRVSADEVRAALPKGRFTVKDVQERTGASPAVVRRIIQEETKAGNVTEEGPDTGHAGPGRSPIVYKG